MARFFAVGFVFFHPDAPAESFPHDVEVSLDDADVVLFNLPYAPPSHSTFRGKPSLSDDDSFRYKGLIQRWRSELHSAVTAGKTVFCLLGSPESVYAATGEVETSGTGRNARRTRILAEQSNLDVLPLKLGQVVSGVGDEIRPTPHSRALRQYWERFASLSQYEMRFSPQNNLLPLLTTTNPNQIVGGMVKHNAGGHLVLLPSIDFLAMDDSALRKNCLDLVRQLLQVDANLSEGARLPPPNWVRDTKYETANQHRLRKALLAAQAAEEQARRSQEELRGSLEQASVLQGLLFAQGRPLEDAVIRGLKLMDIEAERFVDGESEFDAVFTVDGQRMLGETEGRDSRAIAIAKITQLERNVAEDFAREDVEEYAHGV